MDAEKVIHLGLSILAAKVTIASVAVISIILLFACSSGAISSEGNSFFDSCNVGISKIIQDAKDIRIFLTRESLSEREKMAVDVLGLEDPSELETSVILLGAKCSRRYYISRDGEVRVRELGDKIAGLALETIFPQRTVGECTIPNYYYWDLLDVADTNNDEVVTDEEIKILEEFLDEESLLKRLSEDEKNAIATLGLDSPFDLVTKTEYEGSKCSKKYYITNGGMDKIKDLLSKTEDLDLVKIFPQESKISYKGAYSGAYRGTDITLSGHCILPEEFILLRAADTNNDEVVTDEEIKILEGFPALS